MYDYLNIEGDYQGIEGLEYHLEQCGNIIALIELLLSQFAVPVGIGIYGKIPTVNVRVIGRNGIYKIWEKKQLVRKPGNGHTGGSMKPSAVEQDFIFTDFNFGHFELEVDLDPGVLSSGSYKFLI